MNKLFLLFFLLLIIPLVHADPTVQALPQPFKTQACGQLAQIYANSTFQNVTAVQLPDNSLILINASMQKSVTGFFNLTFCNTTLNGNYIVNGVGDVDGVVQSWNYQFIVNPLGQVFTTQQALLYMVIFFFSLLLFMLTAVIGIYMPSGNDRDTYTGYIIAVNNLKYVKMFMLCLSYLLLMVIVYIGYMISYAYLNFDFMGNLLNILFIILSYLVLPLFIVGFIITLINAVADSKLSQDLLRGLQVS